MSEAPRPYVRPVSTFWWLQRRSYFLFVLREISSVFVAWFVVYLLLLVDAIASGSEEYARFLDWSASVWVVALNVLSLAFVLLHTVTWFGLAPRAMVVKVRGRRIPASQILAGHYAAWVVASAVIAWVLLR